MLNECSSLLQTSGLPSALLCLIKPHSNPKSEQDGDRGPLGILQDPESGGEPAHDRTLATPGAQQFFLAAVCFTEW